MHFVNASQIGQRKFFGSLRSHKHPGLRSPLKGRNENSPETDGFCTKVAAWIQIVRYFFFYYSVLRAYTTVAYIKLLTHICLTLIPPCEITSLLSLSVFCCPFQLYFFVVHHGRFFYYVDILYYSLAAASISFR